MSAKSLERALAALGIPGKVEVRGSMGVLAVDGDVDLSDPRLRDAAIGAAADHGYTHLALELLDGVHDGASLHRD